MAQPRRPIAAPRTTLPPAAACSLKCVTAAPRSALGTPQYVLVPIGTRQHASVCARARECGTASRATVQARCLTAAAAGGNSSGAQNCTEPIPGSPLNHSAHSQHCGQRDMSPEGMAHCLSVWRSINSGAPISHRTDRRRSHMVACCALRVACCMPSAAFLPDGIGISFGVAVAMFSATMASVSIEQVRSAPRGKWERPR